MSPSHSSIHASLMCKVHQPYSIYRQGVFFHGRYTAQKISFLCATKLYIEIYIVQQSRVDWIMGANVRDFTRVSTSNKILTNWPSPKRAGSWVQINTPMALGIVWRNRIRVQQYNFRVLAIQTAIIVAVRQFCLAFVLVLPLQTIPSAPAFLIPTRVPTRFGNGQYNCGPPASQPASGFTAAHRRSFSPGRCSGRQPFVSASPR